MKWNFVIAIKGVTACGDVLRNKPVFIIFLILSSLSQAAWGQYHPCIQGPGPAASGAVFSFLETYEMGDYTEASIYLERFSTRVALALKHKCTTAEDLLTPMRRGIQFYQSTGEVEAAAHLIDTVLPFLDIQSKTEWQQHRQRLGMGKQANLGEWDGRFILVPTEMASFNTIVCGGTGEIYPMRTRENRTTVHWIVRSQHEYRSFEEAAEALCKAW